ncbi:unnamed protein product [Peniophora sp. CBMAI 1063]|nr:unnamed protein product [Peniophora sp. CBMAI 1063]
MSDPRPCPDTSPSLAPSNDSPSHDSHDTDAEWRFVDSSGEEQGSYNADDEGSEPDADGNIDTDVEGAHLSPHSGDEGNADTEGDARSDADVDPNPTLDSRAGDDASNTSNATLAILSPNADNTSSTNLTTPVNTFDASSDSDNSFTTSEWDAASDSERYDSRDDSLYDPNDDNGDDTGQTHSAYHSSSDAVEGGLASIDDEEEGTDSDEGGAGDREGDGSGTVPESDSASHASGLSEGEVPGEPYAENENEGEDVPVFSDNDAISANDEARPTVAPAFPTPPHDHTLRHDLNRNFPPRIRRIMANAREGRSGSQAEEDTEGQGIPPEMS